MVLSVIIVSWNTADLLRRCLVSVQKNLSQIGGIKSETIVVDNNSSDRTIRVVENYAPEARLIANSENVGFAQANNQAITSSSGSYLLLLNPDTYLEDGAFGNLLDYLEGHPRVGACGPMLLNPDGSLQVSCHPEPTILREAWRLFHLDRFYHFGSYPMKAWTEEVKEVDVLQGACMLLRRSALDEVGLLDEDFFVYSEDVDLCTRLRRAKWKVVWNPKSKVTHYGGQSTEQRKIKMFLMLYQYKVLYFRKHQGALKASLYKLLLCAASLTRILSRPLTAGGHPGEGEKHRFRMTSYWELLKSLPQF